MADSAKAKWAEATHQILLALDILAEYRELGIVARKDTPNSKGWVQCSSAEVPVDRSPSAGVNLHDGPLLGRYKCFRTGNSYTLFDFAATVAGKCGGDWRAVRAYYARKTGVELPDGTDELPSDKLQLSDLAYSTKKFYAAGKPGVTVDAIVRSGAKAARWPKGLPAELQNHLIAVPMYGSGLLDLDPEGWHVVAQHPSRTVRVYRGKGVPEDHVKSMTLGTIGLMNAEGLHWLKKADVVWIVEGISDLWTMMGIMPSGQDGPPKMPDGTIHVVLSSGACTAHPKPEWLSHFAGKDVRIGFDVGDAKNEGQVGAGVWCGQLVQTAKAVRNVELPVLSPGIKNDLRSWITGTDGNSPHDYDDLLELSLTFDPLEPGSAKIISPSQAILQNLGLVVLGEHEGMQWIETYSDNLRKSGTIKDVSRLTIPSLIQLAGPDVVEEHIHDGKEAMPGKFQIKDVRNAIAAAAADRIFHVSDRLGAGVWEAGGKIVIVKAKEAFISNGHVLEPLNVPFLDEKFLDLSLATGNWFDRGQLQRYMHAAANQSWSFDVLGEAVELFAKWFWRSKPAPIIMASLVTAAWIQTLWEWRPQVAITGDSDTGKSLLMEEVLGTGIFGPMSLFILKPTEAAIRQAVRHHGRVILMDEFEADGHRAKVYEMFRGSSRGGAIYRGTQDQKGLKFSLKHMPFYSAIELGHKKGADRNRYIMLDLDEIPAERRGAIELPTTEALRDLGMRMLAVALSHAENAIRLARVLKTTRGTDAPGRVVESFSVPAAIYASVCGWDNEAATDWLTRTLSHWDFERQKSKDASELIKEIFATTVDCGRHSEKETIASLLNRDQSSDVRNWLGRAGIARVRKRTGSHRGEDAMFIEPKIVSQKVLAASGDFHGHAIEQYLLRIKGARTGHQRLAGSPAVFSGIEVPFENVVALLGRAADEEDEPMRSGELPIGSGDGFE